MEEEEEGYEDRESRALGRRAEEVAEWYFRLNGFFLIPGFIVHPDAPRPVPRTEADLLGIRLKDSSEGLWRAGEWDHFRKGQPTSMTDDRLLTDPAKVGTVSRHLVAMVEVKASRCEINGPWSDRGDGDISQSNMARALARVGFGNRTDVQSAAEAMYEGLRYEGKQFVVQYFAVGSSVNPECAEKYPKLIQVTFKQIGRFLQGRFSMFPEKIPRDRAVSLWPGFGDMFCRWFETNGSRQTPSEEACHGAVDRYIRTGHCRSR